jgi:RAD51-like protein 3
MPYITTLALNVNAGVIKALFNANVKTVEDILNGDLGAITKKANITYEALQQVITEIHKISSATPIRGDVLYHNMLQYSAVFSTGCVGIDTLLDGGLYTGEITEIVGQPSSGKSQLCMSAAATMIQTSKDITIAYIDSSSSFSPDRVIDMHTEWLTKQHKEAITSQGMVDLLNHIKYYKCFDAYSLIDILSNIENGLKLKETPHYRNLKLVVVDSIGAIMGSIVGGKQSQGHVLMTSAARLMKVIATDYNIAFLVTNHTVTAMEEGRGKVRAALGESWHSIPNTQVMLTSNPANNTRCATLSKSSRISCVDKTAFFHIQSEGVR